MAQTVLYGALETGLVRAAADHDRLWIPLDDLERSTGWTAKPEGLCRGEVCVPVPAARKADWLDEDGRQLDFAAFSAYLGHAVVRDVDRGVWSFGPPADRGTASASGPVAAPDFQLPDLDGKLHTLSDYRGKKILLHCWASW
ncbi:MAG TPA: hypothetical protein VHN14_06075 [Kofleriaceae bacterium]|jgi:hypothetical protein|nr:hypothetical protein [Kofleriaceae bacterium]